VLNQERFGYSLGARRAENLRNSWTEILAQAKNTTPDAVTSRAENYHFSKICLRSNVTLSGFSKESERK
jgi:hypothetical protein